MGRSRWLLFALTCISSTTIARAAQLRRHSRQPDMPPRSTETPEKPARDPAVLAQFHRAKHHNHSPGAHTALWEPFFEAVKVSRGR